MLPAELADLCEKTETLMYGLGLPARSRYYDEYVACGVNRDSPLSLVLGGCLGADQLTKSSPMHNRERSVPRPGVARLRFPETSMVEQQATSKRVSRAAC